MGELAPGVILDPLTGVVVEQHQPDGISKRLNHSHDLWKMLHIFFIAVTWWNAIELMVLVLSTFRRRQGLYFWSLVLANCLGVVPYSLAFLLHLFTDVNVALPTTAMSVGWLFMVTGQSIVLYSRLHLVLCDEVVLRRVLCMIVANVFLLHIPAIAMSWVGTFGGGPGRESPRTVRTLDVMDKVQLVGFTVQELIISTLYIWETTKLLWLRSDRQDRKIMYYLVGINLVMFLMDLILVVVQFAGYFAVQATLQGMFYSIKLKLEFAVLGKLVDVIHHGSNRDGSLGYTMELSSLDHIDIQTGTTATEPSALSSNLNVDDRRQGARLLEGHIIVTKEFSAWVERRPHGNCIL